MMVFWACAGLSPIAQCVGLGWLSWVMTLCVCLCIFPQPLVVWKTNNLNLTVCLRHWLSFRIIVDFWFILVTVSLSCFFFFLRSSFGLGQLGLLYSGTLWWLWGWTRVSVGASWSWASLWLFVRRLCREQYVAPSSQTSLKPPHSQRSRVTGMNVSPRAHIILVYEVDRNNIAREATLCRSSDFLCVWHYVIWVTGWRVGSIVLLMFQYFSSPALRLWRGSHSCQFRFSPKVSSVRGVSLWLFVLIIMSRTVRRPKFTDEPENPSQPKIKGNWNEREPNREPILFQKIYNKWIVMLWAKLPEY